MLYISRFCCSRAVLATAPVHWLGVCRTPNHGIASVRAALRPHCSLDSACERNPVDVPHKIRLVVHRQCKHSLWWNKYDPMQPIVRCATNSDTGGMQPRSRRWSCASITKKIRIHDSSHSLHSILTWEKVPHCSGRNLPPGVESFPGNCRERDSRRPVPLLYPDHRSSLRYYQDHTSWYQAQ